MFFSGSPSALDISVWSDLYPLFHTPEAAKILMESVELQPGYPSQEFVVVTLHTLTLLSAHTLIDIPDQVKG
jgi:hypothetical protein